MDFLRISAKNLGALAMPDFCPRCFWIRMKCRKGLPFQIFPGIFSSIDSYSKKVTNRCYQRSSSLPPWFSGFNGLLNPVLVPHHTDFFVMDPVTGIRLTGVPDEIFKRRDGSYFIADYKTAPFTDLQDDLLPLYDVQLNAYAFIGERCGFWPISGLGLVYYEPQTDLTMQAVESVLATDGFAMPFKAKLVEIHQDREVIPRLLGRVREICNLSEPPAAERACADCERSKEMVRLTSG